MENAWALYMTIYKFNSRDLDKIVSLPECYNNKDVWTNIIKHQEVGISFLVKHADKIDELGILNT